MHFLVVSCFLRLVLQLSVFWSCVGAVLEDLRGRWHGAKHSSGDFVADFFGCRRRWGRGGQFVGAMGGASPVVTSEVVILGCLHSLFGFHRRWGRDGWVVGAMSGVSAGGTGEVVAVLVVIDRAVVVLVVDVDDFVIVVPVSFLVVASIREHHGLGRE